MIVTPVPDLALVHARFAECLADRANPLKVVKAILVSASKSRVR